MVPVRVLLVQESIPVLRALQEELDGCGGFEVQTATSAAAGQLGLARLQPDILIANPWAGRGTPAEWKRAILRYRDSRPLGVLLLADRASEPDREILREIADLGVRPRTGGMRLLPAILAGWAGQEESWSSAA